MDAWFISTTGEDFRLCRYLGIWAWVPLPTCSILLFPACLLPLADTASIVLIPAFQKEERLQKCEVKHSEIEKGPAESSVSCSYAYVYSCKLELLTYTILNTLNSGKMVYLFKFILFLYEEWISSQNKNFNLNVHLVKCFEMPLFSFIVRPYLSWQNALLKTYLDCFCNSFHPYW